MLNLSIAPWPSFTDDEQAVVQNVLRSNRVNYWTGDEGRKFEQEFARWVGAPYAIALANGTLALDLALKGLGIGPGDEVVVTPRTFIASVSCVINAGATPVFADVDLNSGNISPSTILPVLTDRTKAIIPVHVGGWPADMPAIMEIANKRDIYVIEDCAQSHGAMIRGRHTGTWGHVGAWSFCQDKIMTTGGEGGMVTTPDKDTWDRMWSFKDHGKSWDAVYNRQHAPGFRWVHENIGTNWRMLEMQSAIGRVQLRHMSEWTARRTYISKRYREIFSQYNDALRSPVPPEGFDHAYYRQYAYVKPQGLKPDWTRDRIVKEITERGGVAFHGSCSEVYLEKAFDGLDCRPAERLPNARQLGENSLMFLTHPTMTEANIDQICGVIDETLKCAAAG